MTTRAMAKDVLAVLDHAGIQRASVLGTSLGGMIAQELALPHPERVDRLVLVAERLAAAKLAHPQAEPAWRAQVAAGMLFNLLGRHRRITQPTLVVQGTADQVVDPGHAGVLAGLRGPGDAGKRRGPLAGGLVAPSREQFLPLVPSQGV